MTPMFLFFNGGWLNEEWLSTAAAIAITFIVFVIGVPFFILQTFLAGNLRDVYQARTGKNGFRFLICGIFVTILIFLLGNPALVKAEMHYLGNTEDHWILSVVVIILLAFILVMGIVYLSKNFRSAHSIEDNLSKLVVKAAIEHYRAEDTKQFSRDIEHLSILAAEIRSGAPKKYFLEQIEILIEKITSHTASTQKFSWGTVFSAPLRFAKQLLARPKAEQAPPPKLERYSTLKRILQEVVATSGKNGPDKVSSENRKQVLDLLIYTYHKALKNTDHSYLSVTISHCIKEVGLAALKHEDAPAVTDAIEKLADSSNRYQNLYILANAAFFEKKYVKPIITALRKLETALRRLEPTDAMSKEKQETLYYWLGLLANLHTKPGSTRTYAVRQLTKFETLLKEETFNQASEYFADTMGYFDTADSVRALKNGWFSIGEQNR